MCDNGRKACAFDTTLAVLKNSGRATARKNIVRKNALGSINFFILKKLHRREPSLVPKMAFFLANTKIVWRHTCFNR